MSIKTDKKGGRVLKPSDIMLGMDVKIVSMGLSGIINSLPDDKGNVFVQCGIMKSKVNISDLVIINDAPVVPVKKGINKGKSEASKIKTRKVTSVSPEINLLGKPWTRRFLHWISIWMMHILPTLRVCASCMAREREHLGMPYKASLRKPSI